MLFFLVDFMSNETHLREGTDFGALGSSWRLSLHQLLGDKSSVELSEFFIFIPEDRTILCIFQQFLQKVRYRSRYRHNQRIALKEFHP